MKIKRFWRRDSIYIALYGMSWSKKACTLRNVINRVKFLERVLIDCIGDEAMEVRNGKKM